MAAPDGGVPPSGRGEVVRSGDFTQDVLPPAGGRGEAVRGLTAVAQDELPPALQARPSRPRTADGPLHEKNGAIKDSPAQSRNGLVKGRADAYVPGQRPARRNSEGLPKWSAMQSFSFGAWCKSLCAQVLRSRTSFSEFLRTTLHVDRSTATASEQALFPLPVPKTGIFEAKQMGPRERVRRSVDQAFHIMIMALNFLHSDFRYVPVSALALQPSGGQIATLERLKRMLKAFGNCSETFEVPDSGRRSASLLSLLSDLGEVLTWEGGGGDGYQRGFPGAVGGLEEVRTVPASLDRAEELRPYRDLDPSRLKIVGTAAWSPQDFLSDSLWLAFVEPASLIWTTELPLHDIPNLTKEKYESTLELAKLWDARGLLFLRRVPDDFHWSEGSMRFFNNYKSPECDRMIGDRRLRNWREGRLPGVSRALPTAQQLSVLEVDPSRESVLICISDRRDFYHQFQITDERAVSNGVWPPLLEKDVCHLDAFSRLATKGPTSRYDRTRDGDRFGAKLNTKSFAEGKVQACFASIPQGDHLGVELATEAHRNLLSSSGLLPHHQELRADRTFRGSCCLQGLVIDDFFSISVQADDSPPFQTQAVEAFEKAKLIYAKHGLLGSDGKDVKAAEKAKVIGGELDASAETKGLGLVTLGSPVRKRLALAYISLELAKLPITSDVLHSCLLGGWVHALLYRRQLMSILDCSFKLVDAETLDRDAPKAVHLPRAVAQELVLLAVLCPLMTADLAAPIFDRIYASDASDRKGAFMSRSVPSEVARVMWRSGRKKGGYSRMLNRTEALIRKIDPDFEETQPGMPQSASVSPERPRAHRFHFIEICGGAGKVTKFLAERGWTCGPVLDLDSSRHYNLRNLRFLSWVLHLLENDLLDSFMVEPPCTTFSPAQHPASRGYDCPRGYDPLDEKTLEGTELALRSLTLMFVGACLRKPCLLEQPRKSKMRRLQEWLYLIEHWLAEEQWTASCAFGSPHLKEFVFLCSGLPSSRLHRKCTRDHTHIPIQGSYTKASAVYVDGLAYCIAECFHYGLRAYFEEKKNRGVSKEGLESPLCNDILVSGDWRVEQQWEWKVPSHINIQESGSVYRLLKRAALLHPSSRFSVVMDSNVGLSAFVKGRSPSYGLRKVLRRSGAVAVAGGLYPAYHFGPTRLNIADCPTRDLELPEPCIALVEQFKSFESLLDFASLTSLRRPSANWVIPPKDTLCLGF